MRLALVLLVAGCTHHRPLRDATEVRGDVTIVTFDQRYLPATAIETPTGTAFRAVNGEVYEMGQVARVIDKRHARGAAEGFGIGGGLGVAGGVVLGLAGGDDPPCEDGRWCLFNMSASEKAVFAGIVFGVLGGAIGLATGAMRGSRFVYENGPPVVTPVGPPGSVAGLSVAF